MPTPRMPALLRGLRLKHYPVASADVPWRFAAWGRRSRKGDRSAPYRTMTLAEIADLPVGRYVADDAYLFFWITGSFYAAGAHVPIMTRWGFRPTATVFTWLKPTRAEYYQGRLFSFIDEQSFKMGPGLTTRQNPEFCVLGRRGSPPARLSRAVRAEIVEPARAHSQKPEKFYRRVEQYAAGPYLELFGRTERPGWTSRGDQMGMFGRVERSPARANDDGGGSSR